jgi:hypothetical protein
MALREKKSEAIKMRLGGASYSQIKQQLGVSKSSLSLWLHSMPLPEKRLRELRDWSAVRIERFRNTMRLKRETRWSVVCKRALGDIGVLSERDIFIAGLFLYWGEGSKTQRVTTALSNTDPSMIRFFIRWLESLGVDKKKLRVYVHLYSDMDVEKELAYWSAVLNLPRTSFRNPYIKASKRSDISYTQNFSHGTCNLIYDNRDISEYVHIALKCIQELFAPTKGV